MSIVTEIREYIKCPQFGDLDYGKWGALRFDQRYKIKRLCDYTESLEYIVERKDKMSKEDYAQLHYLLAKLKYTLAELSLNRVNEKLFNKQIDEIDDICKICIIDGKEKD